MVFALVAAFLTSRIGHSLWAYGMATFFLLAGIPMAFFTEPVLAWVDRLQARRG